MVICATLIFSFHYDQPHLFPWGISASQTNVGIWPLKFTVLFINFIWTKHSFIFSSFEVEWGTEKYMKWGSISLFNRSSWFLWYIILQNFGISIKPRHLKDENLTDEIGCTQTGSPAVPCTVTGRMAQIFRTMSWFLVEISMAGDVGKGFKEVVIMAMILGQETAKETFQVWSTYIFMITGAAIGINSEFHKQRAQFY